MNLLFAENGRFVLREWQLVLPLESLNLAGNNASNSCLHQQNHQSRKTRKGDFHVPPTSREMHIYIYICMYVCMF